MGSKKSFEAIIVGCGIADASSAHFLSERGMEDILLLEKEEQPAYHSSGGSALLAPRDPGSLVRARTAATHPEMAFQTWRRLASPF
jgi:glycine/D-amino acid oxidase-like deaminating enzyme